MNNDPDNYLVKVADFGIAGLHQDKIDAGTPAYMAPESLVTYISKRTGKPVYPVTTNAIDVWAIGIMFFAMLYGSRPFLGKTSKEL